MSKTKEQLNEEMKLALSIRIKPLDLEGLDSDELKKKVEELYNTIVQLETDKYDYEQRRVAQDYELKELKERQKVQLRQKALKKGLDPEALTGKHPPKIRMYSKYERRTDTRTYEDRKKLYEGGWEVIRAETLEAMWKEKYEEWTKRPRARLPKWFGERPGKKAGDPETPEDEEAGEAPPPEVEEEEEEEEVEEEEEEEEE
jgi:troponin T, fast skeletal muscle